MVPRLVAACLHAVKAFTCTRAQAANLCLRPLVRLVADVLGEQ
jgi:hypothetical protein